jgi:hypothetical protein
VTPRLASALLVTALIRRTEGAGGHGAVLAKGDAQSGAILLVLMDRGRTTGVRERSLGHDERYAWSPAGPADMNDAEALAEYLARRRRTDPDQWIVELDHADALELAQGMLG